MSDPVPTAQEPAAPNDRATIAARWWRDMQDRTPGGEPNRFADRTARARLRRAEGSSAAAEPAMLRLYHGLGGEGWNRSRVAIAVRLALVLAHVREEARGSDGDFAVGFARSLGPTVFGGDDAVMSPLRLRALLAAREETDIVRRFRRAVALLDGRANVRSLARVLIAWDDEATRTRFAFDYFGAGVAAPAAEAPASAL